MLTVWIDKLAFALRKMDEAYTLRCDIRALNKIFRRACQQVILMNNRIEEMKARYDRARASNRRSFRYTNRLKLCVIEGVRNMYYDFACSKCDEIEDKQAKLRNISGQEYDFTMDSDDEDEEDEEEGSSPHYESPTPEYAPQSPNYDSEPNPYLVHSPNRAPPHSPSYNGLYEAVTVPSSSSSSATNSGQAQPVSSSCVASSSNSNATSTAVASTYYSIPHSYSSTGANISPSISPKYTPLSDSPSYDSTSSQNSLSREPVSVTYDPSSPSYPVHSPREAPPHSPSYNGIYDNVATISVSVSSNSDSSSDEQDSPQHSPSYSDESDR